MNSSSCIKKKIKVKIIVICFGILSLFSACKNEAKDYIEVQPINVKISSIQSDVSLTDIGGATIVPLQTSDTLLINEITRIHNSKDYIYLSDLSSIYKFSYKGEFISRINKQGTGPDEYINVSDFQIDDDDNVWVLCRNTHSLYLYSWDNHLKRKLNFDLWVENIFLFKDNMLLYTGNEIGKDNKNQLHLLDIAKGNIVNHFKAVDEYQSGYLHVKGTNLFQTTDNDTVCYFSQLFNDTVYSITPNSFHPEYVFEWEGKNIPKDFYSEKYQDIMDFFQHLNAKNAYVYGVNSFLETNNSFWVTYFYQGKCYCAIIPKDKASERFVFNQLRIDGLLENYPVNLSESSIFTQNSGEIVIPLDVMSIMEYVDKLSDESSKRKIIESIHYYSDDQNPLLLIVVPK